MKSISVKDDTATGTLFQETVVSDAKRPYLTCVETPDSETDKLGVEFGYCRYLF